MTMAVDKGTVGFALLALAVGAVAMWLATVPTCNSSDAEVAVLRARNKALLQEISVLKQQCPRNIGSPNPTPTPNPNSGSPNPNSGNRAEWWVDRLPFNHFDGVGGGASFSELYSLPRKALVLTDAPNLTTTADIFGRIPRHLETVFEMRAPHQISTCV